MLYLPDDYYLPIELCEHILSFVEPHIKYCLNRTYYKQYHYSVYNNIFNTNYNNYIRDMIRNDNIFVFDRIVIERFDSWINIKKMMFESFIFPNYVHYIQYIINKYNADKCKTRLVEELKKRDLFKNWHKKNRIKNIHGNNKF